MGSHQANNSVAPRRRWLRFSLRTFLLVLTALCIWLGMKVNQARRQKEAVKALRELGAKVFYAHQQGHVNPNVFDSMQEPGVPRWLRSLAGDDFFQSVASVHISPQMTDADLVHFHALSPLRNLCVTNLSVRNAGVTDRGLARLPRLDQLVFFYADNSTSVGDAFVKRLAQAERLEFLILGRTRVTDNGLQSLQRLTKVRYLALEYTGVGDAGLVGLKEMSSLSQLRLEGTRVTDAGLIHLARLKSLTGLDLGDTSVGDAGLMHLREKPQLGTLVLQRTNVRGPGLAHLAENLRELVLSAAPIDDAGLMYLKDAKRMNSLHLNGTAITDAGLGHLRDLPALNRIFLADTKVTKEGVAELKAAIPNLTVFSD